MKGLMVYWLTIFVAGILFDIETFRIIGGIASIVTLALIAAEERAQ